MYADACSHPLKKQCCVTPKISINCRKEMLHVICTGNGQIKGTLFILMMRTLNMSQLNSVKLKSGNLVVRSIDCLLFNILSILFPHRYLEAGERLSDLDPCNMFWLCKDCKKSIICNAFHAHPWLKPVPFYVDPVVRLTQNQVVLVLPIAVAIVVVVSACSVLMSKCKKNSSSK